VGGVTALSPMALFQVLIVCLLGYAASDTVAGTGFTKYLLHHQAKKVMIHADAEGKLVTFEPIRTNVIEFAELGTNQLTGSLNMDIYLSNPEYFPTRIEYGSAPQTVNPANSHRLDTGVFVDVPAPSTGWQQGWNKNVRIPLQKKDTYNAGLCDWRNASRFSVYRSGNTTQFHDATATSEFIKLRAVRLFSSAQRFPNDNRMEDTWGMPTITGNRVALFNGVSSYAGVSNSQELSFGGKKAFTLEAWIHPDEQTTLGALFSMMRVGSGGEYLLSVDQRGAVGIHRSSKRGANLYATGVVPFNKWSHVAATYETDNSMLSIYINGVLSGQQESTEQATASEDIKFVVGATAADFDKGGFPMANFFKGAMVEMKVWKVALSPLQIIKSMRGYIDGEDGLVARWPLNNNGWTDVKGGHNLGPHDVLQVPFETMKGSAEVKQAKAMLDFVAATVCPSMCSGNGLCFRGRCACDDEHEGADCGFAACPNGCSGHGMCFGSLGDRHCKCDEPYSGKDCSSFKCPAGCDEHGVCDGDGKCICDKHTKEGGKWFGPSCKVSSCHLDCSGHGKCSVTTGFCECDSAWKGDGCAEPVCPNACSGHGKCDVRTGKCTCDYAWSGQYPKDVLKGEKNPGPDCSLSIGPRTSCHNDCNFGGKCDNGKCICNKGRGGDFCEAKACPNEDTWEGVPPCSGHGSCDRSRGKCFCNEFWAGDDCGENRFCWKNCSNRGHCREGKCWCNDGFYGQGCEKSYCQEDENGVLCSGRGKCGCHGCKCFSGYGGPNCEGNAAFPMKCVTMCGDGCDTKCARADAFK